MNKRDNFLFMAIKIDKIDKENFYIDYISTFKDEKNNFIDIYKLPQVRCINRNREIERFYVVEYLINKGESVNDRDQDGNTPLHIAAQYKRESAAFVLLSKGADVNAKNTAGLTPLMIAAKNLDAKMIKLLLENGANVDERDLKLYSALMFASQNDKHINYASNEEKLEYYSSEEYAKREECVKLLVGAGADIHAEELYGTPATTIACDDKLKGVMIKEAKKYDESATENE